MKCDSACPFFVNDPGPSDMAFGQTYYCRHTCKLGGDVMNNQVCDVSDKRKAKMKELLDCV